MLKVNSIDKSQIDSIQLQGSGILELAKDDSKIIIDGDRLKVKGKDEKWRDLPLVICTFIYKKGVDIVE